jgi:hypothetical protein
MKDVDIEDIKDNLALHFTTLQLTDILVEYYGDGSISRFIPRRCHYFCRPTDLIADYTGEDYEVLLVTESPRTPDHLIKQIHAMHKYIGRCGLRSAKEKYERILLKYAENKGICRKAPKCKPTAGPRKVVSKTKPPNLAAWVIKACLQALGIAVVSRTAVDCKMAELQTQINERMDTLCKLETIRDQIK